MDNEINGIYEDDGNKTAPNAIPIHGLCIICKSYNVADWEENLLCNLNRFDQLNFSEFKCAAYVKMKAESM